MNKSKNLLGDSLKFGESAAILGKCLVILVESCDAMTMDIVINPAYFWDYETYTSNHHNISTWSIIV